MTQIIFGERRRTLRFDIAAMLALESAMDGKPSGDIVASLGRWSFTAFVLVLWAGLKHEDKTLTPKLVQKMLERYVTQPGANVHQLRKDVTTAIEESQWYQQIAPGDADEDDEEAPTDPNP